MERTEQFREGGNCIALVVGLDLVHYDAGLDGKGADDSAIRLLPFLAAIFVAPKTKLRKFFRFLQQPHVSS